MVMSCSALAGFFCIHHQDRTEGKHSCLLILTFNLYTHLIRDGENVYLLPLKM